ncbi:LysR family transcriptional regulator [Litoreibacter ponti]|uniref:LysR family transcriptional regulator n=1 Tax=Litoreibacter ponti TaxID=1510457 RepID=A0A2T6BED8_9RHOB|nr:LysR substrate-binding domain-containing protein [Litoreibacter ponti]PTX54411.1 LysR family transcriptional regulator [Litoreibacter ponti]
MSRTLPPLNALRAFEAAGRHQSFSGAAEELHVSHSAISRHVRGLEDRLGVQLFREASRGVALTQAGARYLAQVTPALDVIAEATEAFHDTPRGRLVVNSEPTFAIKFLIPRLAEFEAAHPEVELRLEASQELADLARYEADLAIRSIASGKPEQASELISNAPMRVYGAPSLVGKGLDAPEQVLQFRRYQDRHGNPWGQWAAQAGLDPALFPAPDWRMRSMLSLDAALAGHGVILCTGEVTADACARGHLVQCLPYAVHSGSYHLVFGEGARRRAPARAFRDWLIDITAPYRVDEYQPNG